MLSGNAHDGPKSYLTRYIVRNSSPVYAASHTMEILSTYYYFVGAVSFEILGKHGCDTHQSNFRRVLTL